MNKFYLYTNLSSYKILMDTSDKAILIGSDFGYGNFGDILQHANALRLVKKCNRYKTVSIFSTEVISSSGFADWAHSAYGSDVIIFVSSVPLLFEEDKPDIVQVTDLRNVSLLFLYGGGFLNDKWGDYVLGVTEFFLDRIKNVTYLVSGQQVTHPYEDRVLQHIHDYRPVLFGVRDELSFEWLCKAGYRPEFSFDDATEALFGLAEKVQLQRSTGLLLHLNVSDYTANAAVRMDLRSELRHISGHSSAFGGVSALQAFKDVREHVKDTREAIKFLDLDFPFAEYRTIELATFCYPGITTSPLKPLCGEVGYSCSYHVALWLQLNGIPCWLRSQNPFYDQKAKSLQITHDVVRFLEDPYIADHRFNLERRACWMESLFNKILNAPSITQVSSFGLSENEQKSWRFYYKGTPTLEEKLKWWTGHSQLLESQLTEQRVRVRDLGERLDAMSAQLTETGQFAHAQRQRAEVAEVQVGRAHEEMRQLTRQVDQIVLSRSWKFTKPMRAVARYLKHGYFDANGQVGLYGFVQRVGRRLPISNGIRSRIGCLLSKFRRQG